MLFRSELAVSQLQEALFGLNRRLLSERRAEAGPLQGIKNTLGSLRDELFADDEWDDWDRGGRSDPWDTPPRAPAGSRSGAPRYETRYDSRWESAAQGSYGLGGGGLDQDRDRPVTGTRAGFRDGPSSWDEESRPGRFAASERDGDRYRDLDPDRDSGRFADVDPASSADRWGPSQRLREPDRDRIPDRFAPEERYRGSERFVDTASHAPADWDRDPPSRREAAGSWDPEGFRPGRAREPLAPEAPAGPTRVPNAAERQVRSAPQRSELDPDDPWSDG